MYTISWYLRKALMSGRLPKTIEMMSINGIWEECLIQPLKVNERDETFVQMRKAIEKQVMEAVDNFIWAKLSR